MVDSTILATVSGEVWFIHPITLINAQVGPPK